MRYHKHSTITEEQIEGVIEILITQEVGEFTDSHQLKEMSHVKTRHDAKEVLSHMMDRQLVVPHPGSKYKIEP